MSDNRDNENSDYPKLLERKVERVLAPFKAFIRNQTTGSILLIVCTIIALIIQNSTFAHQYQSLIHMPIGFVFGDWSFKMSVQHWINDGLMALFFFVLGLEIKREILVGELKDPQQSLPVIAAALGGMLIPAAIFFAINAGSTTARGWGIPMATDAAFAVGVLALLGRRIPIALVTFLTALAIIDDLGAILVIAVFYTETISLPYLSLAILFLVALTGCNAFGFRHPAVYILGGVLVWAATLGSGVHATVAGILVALIVPARPKRGPKWFVRHTRKLINKFENIEEKSTQSILGEEEQHAALESVQDNVEKATTPLRRWEHALETPVLLLVMSVFALANAGIPLSLEALSTLWTDPLSLGIILGLLLGKSIGISIFAWLVLRLGLGRLSEGVTIRHIIGIGLLGGMGFTMSIFVAGLGFANSPEDLVSAKTAILLASLIAGLAGYLWLLFCSDDSNDAANRR